MLVVKGMRFPIEVILVCICWYAAYPLSCRHLEEMMEERGVSVEHSILTGIELMHMICKGQMMMEGADKMSFAEQFYALAE